MSNMMTLYVPEDKAMLAAYGELTILHEHLILALRMTIKTLANLGVKEALDATAPENTSGLRDRIRKLAKQRLGEGEALLKLQAIIEECRQATEKRNSYVHDVVMQDSNGEPWRRGKDHILKPLPTEEDLKILNAEIQRLANELIKVRLEGFLAEALSKRPPMIQDRLT